MIERRRWPVLLAVVGCLGAGPALAQADSEDTPWIDIHGFGSQGFILTTGNDYLVTDSKRGSFQVSDVGLNFSKQLTDRFSFGVQFVAQNFGAAGNYTPKVDWFYLDYRWRDWLGLRAGRLKIPLGLHNEVNDIDSARVPVLLPQSVYPLQARSFLFAQTGAELYGFARSRWAGAIDYRVYGGTIFIDPGLVVPVGSQIQLKLNVPYAFGGRVIWETPLPGLRLAISGLKLRLDTVAFIPPMPGLPMGLTAGIENNSEMWAASLEYAVWALTFTAEYSRGHSKQESALPSSNLDRTGDNGYVMLTYAALPWLQPGIYYSLHFPDVDKRDGLENKQRDLSLTLRFDLNRHWLVKLEGHYMVGTAGLTNPLNISPSPVDPETHWGVFLVKTTAYF